MQGRSQALTLPEAAHRAGLLRDVADVFAEEGFRTIDTDPNWALWCGSLADMLFRLAGDVDPVN